ncbi:MAG: UDP-N-acetylmuramate dehydrogenase [Cyanothece sp. SIO1E1]|nr:UDP-N-acetylmuramate dehydrogenase [Cyanothece sp. SIO1E1]
MLLLVNSVTPKPEPRQRSATSDQAVYLPGTQCFLASQFSLSALTSFRVGGPAEWYIAPHHIEELKVGFAWAYSQGLPITLLGAGSNLLVSDRGLPGLVICTRHLRQLQFDAQTGRVTAGAGISLPRLAWKTADLGWRGLEWTVGIPGTVGGAIVMNAGAHSSCMADLLVEAQVLCPDGTTLTLKPEDLGYSYRTSILQGDHRLVTQATFQLQPGVDPTQVRVDTEAHLNRRMMTQPYHRPSCGSVFRNSEQHAAGWLIEQSGLKGYQIGKAQVAQRHANFILNCGGATANDIFKLIQHIQQQVEQQWSLHLKPEVQILGDFQPI